jgi:FkbM family methyltransferase
MVGAAKNLIRKVFAGAGLDVKRISNPVPVLAGSAQRPVGMMGLLLEDLRVRGLSCKSIMDVGAHRANWSRLAQNVFPDAKFTLIEPLIEMEPELQRFCADHPTACYFLAGAGAEGGSLVLTLDDHGLSGSSFLPQPDEKLLKVGKQREIKIITIDDLVSSNACPMPDLMKLDVQGFELEALKGASSTFGRTAGYILEVSLFCFYGPKNPIFHEVVCFMKQRGYVAYDFGGFMRRSLDGALGQCDICFVQENGIFRTANDWWPAQ